MQSLELALPRAVRWQSVARPLWFALAGLVLLVLIVTTPARYIQLLDFAGSNRIAMAVLGLSPAFIARYIVTLDFLAVLAYALIATVIFWRGRGDWMAVFVSIMLVAMSIVLVRPPEAMALVDREWRIPVTLVRCLGTGGVIAFIHFFPDGRFVPRWTGWLALFWIAGTCAWYFAGLNTSATIWSIPSTPPAFTLGWVVSGLAIQVYRYFRVSRPAQRQQIKWVLAGIIGAALGFLGFSFIAPALYPTLDEPGVTRVYNALIGVPLLYGSMTLLPASIAFSILRHRLWDIDLIMNRALTYGVVTAILALIYFGGVVVLEQLLQTLVGGGSTLAIVGSTLAIAALFTPVRRRTQAAIDRRFFRPRYDAARTLSSFAAQIRNEIDLTALTQQVEAVIWETMLPAHVFTWLKTPDGYSIHLFSEDEWSPGDAAMRKHLTTIPLGDPLVALLSRHPIVELEHTSGNVGAIARMKAAGIRLIVPLVSQGELVGWLTLGARLSEHDYSTSDHQLLVSLATHAAPAIRVAQLIRQQQAESRERERLAQEMRLAKLIQQTLLPRDMPRLAGWEVATYYQSAQAIGGDFFDFLPFEDGRLGIAIGDVAGKGIPAALLMATTRSLLRSVADASTSPAAVLERMNELMVVQMPTAMFVTCLYAILDPASGRLRYANAGHALPYYRANGHVAELPATGLPLGLLPGATYEEQESDLGNSNFLLLYSDGLTEARNVERELFGTDRLRTLLAYTTASGSSLVDCLIAELASFTGPAWDQDDDVAIVLLGRAT